MPTIDVLDSTIHYEREGDSPFVYLHGNPTSSHVWRNVLPRTGGLAPDLIGMGRSGKPDIAYRFADHARYLDAWFDALDARGRDPRRLRLGRRARLRLGRAAPRARARHRVLRDDPQAARVGRVPAGRAGALQGLPDARASASDWCSRRTSSSPQALHATTLNPLSDADYAIYAAPYPTPESRRPLLEWSRSTPIGGEPAEWSTRVEAYDAWLASSDDVPKLLLTFDSSPTLLIGPELTAWCEANIANLEIMACGPAGHMAPEDQPEAIATAILEKLGRFLTAGR